MKIKQIRNILIAILSIALLFVLFQSSRSLKEAKRLAEQLEVQVDSLTNISNEYQDLRREYDHIVKDLEQTQNSAEKMKEKLASITQQNILRVASIRNELKELIDQYDSMKMVVEVDTVELDSLKF